MDCIQSASEDLWTTWWAISWKIIEKEETVVGRSRWTTWRAAQGITFSLLLRRQGKARLDRKVVQGLEARIRGNVRDVCTYIRRKPRKVQQKFCENRHRRSRLMDASPSARAFLGLAASPKVWLREKNASQANATCESRAILPQWHGEYRLFSSVKYARVTLAMARCRIRGKHNRIFYFRNERRDFC